MASGPRQLLERLFRHSVGAVQPPGCLAGHWPSPPVRRLVLLAVGKCGEAMAGAAYEHYGGRIEGLVVAPDRYLAGIALPRCLRVMKSRHPIPDNRSVAAAEAALDLARSLGPDDLLLVLLSGGGSAAMCKPAPGVTLAAKQSLQERLLESGASIAEINCVRKQLSAIKGGRLAAACRAPVVTLAISDVSGDVPALIASGPTVADRSTPRQALQVLDRYDIEPPEAVRSLLSDPDAEAPVHADRAADRYTVVAGGDAMLRAAERELRRLGYHVTNLGATVEGAAADVAQAHAQAARQLAHDGGRHCILSGGECTVTIRGSAGTGGRNTEYLLALAVALDGLPGTWAIAADSDGIDGNGDHAGAILGPDSLARARRLGLNASTCLQAHDSGSFFAATGDLLVTGPTRTNVSDFRALLLE
jgi:glycerate 2-kinase